MESVAAKESDSNGGLLQLATLILLGLLIIVAAGFIQGLTSFGFALISMPLLAKLIPLQEVVPITVILSLCTNIVVLANCWRFVELRRISLLIVSSLVAAPLGTILLLYVDPDRLKLFAGILIILFAILLLSGKSFPVRREKLAYIPVGFTSGVLNGSISMSGPPVALFLTNQGVGKETFRANITAYGVILNVITIFTYGMSGLLTADVVRYSLWFVPGMFIGVFLGILAVKWLSERIFKKLALYLLILSGCWTVLTSLKIV